MIGRVAGGSGSGNFGHAGRPGEVGGSGSGGVSPEAHAFTPTEHFDLHAVGNRRFLFHENGTIVLGAENLGENVDDPTEDSHAEAFDDALKTAPPGVPSDFDSYALRGEFRDGTLVIDEATALILVPDSELDEATVMVHNQIYDFAQRMLANGATANTGLLSQHVNDGRETRLSAVFPELFRKKGARTSMANPDDLVSETEQPISPRDLALLALRTMEAMERAAGGHGSGNFGHEGRPGEVGGSGEEAGGYAKKELEKIALSAGEKLFGTRGHSGKLEFGGVKSVSEERASKISRDASIDDYEYVFKPSTGKGIDASGENIRQNVDNWKDTDGKLYTYDTVNARVRVIDVDVKPTVEKDPGKTVVPGIKRENDPAYGTFFRSKTHIAVVMKPDELGHMVEYGRNSDSASKETKVFKTRPDAEKFAVGYVQKHLEAFRDAGGAGSGNFGHAGRPGEIGGSGPGGGATGGGIGRPSSDYPPARADGLDTQERFKVGKQYTPERQVLHKEIIAKFFEGKTPVDHPTRVLLGGGPASGKSTLEKAQGLSEGNVVLVNADQIKELLPEFREGQGAKPGATPREQFGEVAALVHEESSDVAKMIMDAAVAGSYSVVLDGTGDSSLEKLGGKIAAMRAGGAEVVGKYVTLPTDLAVQLAEARGNKMIAEGKVGRFVPETYLRETHAAVSNTFAEALRQGLFDRAELYDTTENRNMRPVASAVGKQITIHNQELWNTFLAKGRE